MTKSAIQTLTELTYLYATTSLANDLVSFSVHANRRTVTPDDVLLVARKNEDLLTKLKDYASSTNLLPVSVPPAAVSRSVAASKALGAKSSASSLNTSSKHSPRPKRRRNTLPSSSSPAPSSSSSSSRAASSRYHRELRQRMLHGTDSERSSGGNDDDSIPLVPSKSKDKKGPISQSNKAKSLMRSAKRRFIESSSDDDEPPIATKRKKQSALPAKTRTMEDISALLSSGEDSMDF